MEKCLSFAADKASVMSGIHKGVVAFVKRQNEDVDFVGESRQAW